MEVLNFLVFQDVDFLNGLLLNSNFPQLRKRQHTTPTIPTQLFQPTKKSLTRHPPRIHLPSSLYKISLQYRISVWFLVLLTLKTFFSERNGEFCSRFGRCSFRWYHDWTASSLQVLLQAWQTPHSHWFVSWVCSVLFSCVIIFYRESFHQIFFYMYFYKL